MAFSKGADQKTEYAVTLSADDITKPLTVADVMGSAEQPIPGLSDLGLTALILNKTDKGATQSATLTYQGKSATIEVLRKQGDNSPVVALSIDGALDFAKLIPGNALDGGSLTNLTMLIVPEGQTLLPTDESISDQLQTLSLIHI